jgi:hypothetical protein
MCSYGWLELPSPLLFFAYVLAVGLAAPWLFRRHWIDIPRSKKAIVFSSSVLLAAASYVA